MNVNPLIIIDAIRRDAHRYRTSIPNVRGVKGFGLVERLKAMAAQWLDLHG